MSDGKPAVITYVKTANGNGVVKAGYTYDAWGNITSVTDTTNSTVSIAARNSLRYRGYVYDSETNLYYLQSRYYDPQTGRFISADQPEYIGAVNTYVGYNGFTYCFNSPIIFSDSKGNLGWPGEIHKQVLLHIKNRYRFLEVSKVKIKYNSKSYGYCDIINPITGEIWELKRNTISLQKAKKQLAKYVGGVYIHKPELKLRIGGSLITYASFEYSNLATTYYIAYWNTGQGIIYYDYAKSSNLLPKPQEMEAYYYAIIAYYAVLTIVTILTGGATAPAYLIG